MPNLPARSGLNIVKPDLEGRSFALPPAVEPDIAEHESSIHTVPNGQNPSYLPHPELVQHSQEDTNFPLPISSDGQVSIQPTEPLPPTQLSLPQEFQPQPTPEPISEIFSVDHPVHLSQNNPLQGHPEALQASPLGLFGQDTTKVNPLQTAAPTPPEEVSQAWDELNLPELAKTEVISAEQAAASVEQPPNTSLFGLDTRLQEPQAAMPEIASSQVVVQPSSIGLDSKETNGEIETIQPSQPSVIGAVQKRLPFRPNTTHQTNSWDSMHQNRQAQKAA